MAAPLILNLIELFVIDLTVTLLFLSLGTKQYNFLVQRYVSFIPQIAILVQLIENQIYVFNMDRCWPSCLEVEANECHEPYDVKVNYSEEENEGLF